MTVDHRGKVLEGPEPLPPEGRAPILEEAPGPALAVVAPELPEGFFQHVGGVQALVGREEQLETLFPLEREIVPPGQEGVLLAFDEAPILARQPRVLALSHRVERIAQMAQHMELVKEDAGVRRLMGGRVAKRLPHVHHHQSDPRGFPGAQPHEELIQARLGAIHAAEPDRPPADQVADDDPIGVPFPDRDLVDANDLRPRSARAPQLLAHVLHLELFDGVPLEMQLLGDVVDRRRMTTTSDVERQALGVARIVGQEVEPFALHRTTAAARDATHLELQKDPHPTAREIAHPAHGPIVDAALHTPADATGRFFERRTSLMIRRWGSPNTPTTVCSGRKPGKRYESERRRDGLRSEERRVGKGWRYE